MVRVPAQLPVPQQSRAADALMAMTPPPTAADEAGNATAPEQVVAGLPAPDASALLPLVASMSRGANPAMARSAVLDALRLRNVDPTLTRMVMLRFAKLQQHLGTSGNVVLAAKDRLITSRTSIEKAMKPKPTVPPRRGLTAKEQEQVRKAPPASPAERRYQTHTATPAKPDDEKAWHETAGQLAKEAGLPKKVEMHAKAAKEAARKVRADKATETANNKGAHAKATSGHAIEGHLSHAKAAEAHDAAASAHWHAASQYDADSSQATEHLAQESRHRREAAVHRAREEAANTKRPAPPSRKPVVPIRKAAADADDAEEDPDAADAEAEAALDADPDEDTMQKAEGDRGGHVIGHTSTGKPIYAAPAGYGALVAARESARGTPGHEAAKDAKDDAEETHVTAHKFSAKEHGEAAAVHEKLEDDGLKSNNPGKAYVHRQMRVAHLNAMTMTKGGDMADPFDSLCKAFPIPEMQKGEGDRGGHVVGHTAGGKPVYESKAIDFKQAPGPSGRVLGKTASGKDMHEHPGRSQKAIEKRYEGWSANDHYEASKRFAAAHSTTGMSHLGKMADFHQKAGMASVQHPHAAAAAKSARAAFDSYREDFGGADSMAKSEDGDEDDVGGDSDPKSGEGSAEGAAVEPDGMAKADPPPVTPDVMSKATAEALALTTLRRDPNARLRPPAPEPMLRLR